MHGYRLAAALVVLIAACQPRASENESDAATKASADATAAVARVREGWVDAWKRADAAAVASLYAANAVDMTNHQPTAAGVAAIRQMATDIFAQMTPTEVTLTSEKVAFAGDLAYDRGTFRFGATLKNGAVINDSGRYLVILQRQADGAWKILEGMGNSATPLPAR